MIEFKSVELDGVRYVILRESLFEQLCRKAGVEEEPGLGNAGPTEPGFDLDRATLSEKIIRRRRASGLSQAELARRAGIRPETLNRIERGKSTPDFKTVRKLVVAINAAERQSVNQVPTRANEKEPKHGD